MQQKFKAGERVKHASKTSWGLGEVLTDSTADRVKVLFEDEGIKEFLLPSTNFIRVSGEEADSDYMTALVENYKSERNQPVGSKKSKTFKTFPKAVEIFLDRFANGFQDTKYLEGKSNERNYKVVAHESMVKQLNQEVFTKLLENGEFNEICIRAKNVLKINLIYKFENILINNALAKAENQEPFAVGLFDVLFGSDDMKIRFERFSKMLYEINAAKWPIATLFLFIMFPDNHMFLKPTVTQNAADVLGMDINYRSDLNWLTYNRVLELAEMIRTKLIKDGREILAPRDLIDVQSFIWAIAPSYDI